jgi:hypothetical protein
MITRLTSRYVFACYCQLQETGILVGILVVKEGGITRLFNPETEDYYWVNSPLESGIYYSQFMEFSQNGN